MQQLSSATPDSAWVKSVEIQCADQTWTQEFTSGSQSTVLFRSLEGCMINLTSFVVDQGSGGVTFTRSARMSQGFVVYDAPSLNEADARLAKGSFDTANHCGTDSACDYHHVNANFIYSELLSENIKLENNLAVTSFSVGIEKEPAPWCKLMPRFEQTGSQAPELVIDFADCIHLFPSGTLELAVMAHQNGAVYSHESLHQAINDGLRTEDGAAGFQIRLTVEDLKALAGTDDIFEALSLDLVIPTRNKDGMSIKYYVIDNMCEMTENPPTVHLSECETAFAFGNTTLIDLGISSKWGWEITVNPGDNLVTPLYAGAGNNVIANATQVGTLTYNYTGTNLTVTYNMYNGAALNETHLYVGTTHPTTAAPGQFTYQHTLSAASSDSYSVTVPAASTLYVVAHATVCPAQN